jgi:hypothetical protein
VELLVSGAKPVVQRAGEWISFEVGRIALHECAVIGAGG